MSLTRPNPIQMGWVGFFLTHHDGLGKKIILTRPNPTHVDP